MSGYVNTFIQITVLFILMITVTLQVVQQHYTAMGVTIGLDLPVEFESDSISLKLPPEGVMLENGWRITPLTPPVVRKFIVGHQNLIELTMFALTQITKQQVDSFRLGQAIPSFQLRAEWTEQSKPVQLIHKVTLNGAKEPFNYFRIVLKPDPTQPGTPR